MARSARMVVLLVTAVSAASACDAVAAGGTDSPVRTSEMPFPDVTQLEPELAADGDRAVATYTDSGGGTTDLRGLSWSADGGRTWTQLPPGTLGGAGNEFGSGEVAWNPKENKFFLTSISSGCGSGGIAVWDSPTGESWTRRPCAAPGTANDVHALAVDATPASPAYGRMYLAYNDFAVNGGAIRLVTSDDGGATWSPPADLTTVFRRVTDVDVAPDGTVLVSALDENGGGVNARTHLVLRSAAGGSGFSPVTVAAGESSPGGAEPSCANTFFAYVSPKWRNNGWGQLALGKDGSATYVYTAGAPSDQGNVMMVRSVDGGATWGTPARLDLDTSARTQWQPSIAAAPGGELLATWYDKRASIGAAYDYRGRLSADGGATWGPEEVISDGVSPVPEQVDGSLNACGFGFTEATTYSSGAFLVGWTDGRNVISGKSQPDVFTDRVVLPDPPAAPGPEPIPAQPGGTSPVSGPAPPAASTPQAIALRAGFGRRGKLKSWRRGRSSLAFTVGAPGTLVVKLLRGKATIGRGTKTVTKAGKTKVTVKLTRSGLKLVRTAIRRRRSLKLSVSATVTGAGGAAGKLTAPLTLR